MSKIICVFTNERNYSNEIKEALEKKLQAVNFVVTNEFDPAAALLISVGGDGSLLHTLHHCGFPNIPIIGINTGHLGFFQEIDPTLIDEFIMRYEKKAYKIQKLATIQTTLFVSDRKANMAEVSAPLDSKASVVRSMPESGEYAEYHYISLNEVVLRKEPFGAAHFNISFGDSFVQRFSGDGILVCPPAGSTAYNYALGGCIVDPCLALMQITPIAPLNTTAYRSFTSSLVVPPGTDIRICPEFEEESAMKVIIDGEEHRYDGVRDIQITIADKTVKLLRFDNYDFWSKVKSKFL